MIKVEKKELVKGLVDEFNKVDNYYFADFTGINAHDVTRLRKELRENGSQMKVVKNRLLARILTELNVEIPDSSLLTGSTAVLYSSNDVLIPARKVKEFSDDEVPIKFKGAVLEGRFYTIAEVERLASIPSRDELLAQLVGIFEGAKTALVSVLQAKMQEMLLVLKSLGDTKEE